jgi:hypothetical protein
MAISPPGASWLTPRIRRVASRWVIAFPDTDVKDNRLDARCRSALDCLVIRVASSDASAGSDGSQKFSNGRR